MEHFDPKIGKFYAVVVKLWGVPEMGIARLNFSSRFQLRLKETSRIFFFSSSDTHFVIAKRPFAQMPAKTEKKGKKPTTTEKRKLAKEAEKSDPTSKRPKNDSPQTPSKPSQNASQSSPVRAVINFNGPIPEMPLKDLMNPETIELFSQVHVTLEALTRLMVGF